MVFNLTCPSFLFSELYPPPQDCPYHQSDLSSPQWWPENRLHRSQRSCLHGNRRDMCLSLATLPAWQLGLHRFKPLPRSAQSSAGKVQSPCSNKSAVSLSKRWAEYLTFLEVRTWMLVKEMKSIYWWGIKCKWINERCWCLWNDALICISMQYWRKHANKHTCLGCILILLACMKGTAKQGWQICCCCHCGGSSGPGS